MSSLVKKKQQIITKKLLKLKTNLQIIIITNILVLQSSAPHNFLNPSLNYLGTKTRVMFSGSCLKQCKITYTYWKIVNSLWDK